MELSSTIWNACQRLPKRFHWIHGLYQTSLQNDNWKCYRQCYSTESIRKLAKNPPCTVPSPIRMSALIISPVRGSTCHGQRKAGTRRQLNIRGLMGYDWIILELYINIYGLYWLYGIADLVRYWTSILNKYGYPARLLGACQICQTLTSLKCSPHGCLAEKSVIRGLGIAFTGDLIGDGPGNGAVPSICLGATLW